MSFSELAGFLRDNWPTIAATIVVVTPVVWLVLQYLFKYRIELLEAQKDTLKQQNESLKQQNESLKQQADSLASERHEAQARGGSIEREDTSDMIGDWARIVYEVKSRWRRAMENKLAWPGDSFALVERENTLYTRILARLDRSDLAQDQLAFELTAFRELDDVAEWDKRRDSLMSMVGAALRRTR